MAERQLSEGDLVRLKSGGLVMTVEADRGNDMYTFTWMDQGNMQSILLPGSAVEVVEAESASNDEDQPPIVHVRTLMKRQRREVFDSIQRALMDPREFHWEEVRSSDFQRPDVLVSKLVHSSGFFFLFNSTRDNAFFFTRSPGPNTMVETTDASGWIPISRAIDQWLVHLKQEIHEKDPWDTISETNLMQGGPLYTTDNSPLSVEEQRRIAESIEELKLLFREKANFDEERFGFVANELEGLKESSRKFGKKDFLNQAFSTSVNIALMLATRPEIAREVFNAAIAAFRWLAENPPHFLPLTAIGP